jgi:hypothetical protein
MLLFLVHVLDLWAALLWASLPCGFKWGERERACLYLMCPVAQLHTSHVYWVQAGGC